MRKSVEVENEAIHQDNRKEFFKRFFDLQNGSFVPTGIFLDIALSVKWHDTI